MKYIFFGTPEFAAIILEELINAGFVPAAVVCNPDKPVGRKKIITPPATKLLAQKYNISVLQPESLEIRNWKLEIDKLGGVDLAIIAAYNKIIPKTILDFLPAKFIGVHPSLLPKYRGPSPIQTAILNGDEETGATLYLMDEGIDSGPILAQRELEFPISNFQFPILSQKLAELGADLLVQFLRKINQYLGSPTSKKLTEYNVKEVGLPEIGIKLQPQNETQATYTQKIKTEDGYVKPEDLEKAQKEGGQIALEIARKIRALNPEPGTWTILTPEYPSLIRPEVDASHHYGAGANGSIKTNKRIKLLEANLTPEGKLKLKKIQFEGKKPTFIS